MEPENRSKRAAGKGRRVRWARQSGHRAVASLGGGWPRWRRYHAGRARRGAASQMHAADTAERKIPSPKAGA